MESFISEQERIRQHKAARRDTRLFRAGTGGMLLLFVILCLMTRTANARTMLRIMLISMTALGWACIGFYAGRVRPGKARARHLRTLSEGEPEIHEGIFRVAGGPVQIPGSVRVMRVTLEDGESVTRLYLDESMADRAPPDGSRVKVQAVNRYMTGMEIIASGSGGDRPAQQKAKRPGGIRKTVSSLIPMCILWAMAVAIIGGFVFGRITDTAPENKIEIYADCGVRDAAELADRLEKQMADPIRMVKVRSFDYVLFGDAGSQRADLFIVPASRAEEYRSLFIPLPEEMREEEDLLLLDGEPYGICVFDPAKAIRTAERYFEYDDGERYYLFFSGSSLHTGGNEDASDNRAEDAARALLEIP